MTILKHDAQGFLAGDPIDIGRALAVWDDIRKDVHAIRQGMLGIDKSPAVKAFQEVAQPMAREAFSKSQQKITVAALLRPQSTPFGRGNASSSAKVAQNSAAHAKPISKKAADAVAKPAGRDGLGRFVKSGAQPGGDNGKDAGRDTPDESALSGIADRIASAVSGAGSGLEEADPAVKAFQEVAQPMARGFGVLTGGSSDKRKENWFRRIYASLTGFRKDESAFNKAANKSLKNIEEKPEDGDGGSGMLGGLFPMLAKIPLIGPLLAGAVGAVGALLSKIPVIGSLFKKIPVVGGAGAAAGGAAGAAKVVAGKGILGAGKGLLRKLPLIGALIAGAGAASDIYGSETDDTLSRRDKDKNAGKATGGLAGTLAGGFAGASAGAALGALGGPIGIAIGGFVGGALGMFLGDQAGQIIGDTMGGWVNDLRGADIPGKITVAWDSVVFGFKSVYESIGKAWSGFVDSAKAGWDTISNLFTSAYEGLKSIPVIGPAIQAVETATKKTAEAASTAAAAAKQKAVEVGTKAVEKGKEVAQSTKEKAVEIGTQAAVIAKDAGSKAVDATVQVAGKAGDSINRGATWAAENTTVGKVVKAAGKGVAVVAEKTASAAERAYNVTAATAGSAIEAVMPKGYRHKALFDGIKGGDSLTKYGSYTDEEAAKIRELKTSGANTSANVNGGMSLEVQDKISAQAKKSGLDPVMMQKIAAMESGGNANAISSTGAAGIYQFTGQTASGVGIKNRFDADQNIEGGMKLTRQNQAVLEKSGLPVSAENLYMMHQLGPKSAQEVIRGANAGKSKEDMSPDTQKAMNLNYGANSKTATDYLATNKKALDDRYATVTKDTGGTQTAIAKATQPATTTLAAGTATAATASIATPAAQALAASPAKYQQVQTAFVAAPTMPSFSSPPAITEAPPVVNPLASGGEGRKAISVTMPTLDAGQDLKDRRIAHIVTGGFSA